MRMINFYRIQLEMALNKVQAQQKPEELHLWGKITGKENCVDNCFRFVR